MIHSAFVLDTRLSRYNDPPLVWLFVAAYVAHVVEEFVGGFPRWVATVAGRPLPDNTFIVINVVALIVMIVAARLATTKETLGWLGIGIATVAFANGLLHLLGSLATGTYSPGLITGVVLYLPLGQLALLRAWHQVAQPFFWKGVALGLSAHAVVSLVALASVS